MHHVKFLNDNSIISVFDKFPNMASTCVSFTYIMDINKKNLDGQFMGCRGFFCCPTCNRGPRHRGGWTQQLVGGGGPSQAARLESSIVTQRRRGFLCWFQKGGYFEGISLELLGESGHLGRSPYLGGGNSNIFCSFSSRNFGEMESNFGEHIFSVGLVRPPTSGDFLKTPSGPEIVSINPVVALDILGSPDPLMKVGFEVFFPKPLKVGTRHICPIKIWKESKTIEKTKLKKLKCETNTFGGC